MSTWLSPLTKSKQILIRFLLKFNPALPSQHEYNITVCDDPKFVWFRVAKVCTRTIFDLLNNAEIKLQAEQAMCVHYPYSSYKDYFRFAFVRNPWDRLVSAWKNKVLKANYFGFTTTERERMRQFENFVDFVADLDIENCDHHLRLQCKLIDMNNIDFIGRYENFESDVAIVMRKIGIHNVEIKHLNQSSDSDTYQEYYNDQLRIKVGEIYKKDINIFSYVFD